MIHELKCLDPSYNYCYNDLDKDELKALIMVYFECCADEYELITEDTLQEALGVLRDYGVYYNAMSELCKEGKLHEVMSYYHPV